MAKFRMRLSFDKACQRTVCPSLGESGLRQKYAFIKNPQFLPNHYETLSQ